MDEVELMDQRTLNYVIWCLKNEVEIAVEIHPKEKVAGNKTDVLLQRLTHRQLRVILKVIYLTSFSKYTLGCC